MKRRKEMKAPSENILFRSLVLRKKRRGYNWKRTEDPGSLICNVENTWICIGGVKRIMDEVQLQIS